MLHSTAQAYSKTVPHGNYEKKKSSDSTAAGLIQEGKKVCSVKVCTKNQGEARQGSVFMSAVCLYSLAMIERVPFLGEKK